MGKENSSSGHVADCNIMSTEKNKRHATDAECKVSESLVFGLHETSETRVSQCSAPFSEVCLQLLAFHLISADATIFTLCKMETF